MVAQTDEEIRTYRISRLLGASMVEDTFTRPDNFDLAAYWEQSTERFKSNLPRYPARVRVSSTRWNKFSTERYVTVLNSTAENNDSEWTDAEVEFNTLESACDIILGYGRHAQALSPEQLRLTVYAESKAIVSLYERK